MVAPDETVRDPHLHAQLAKVGPNDAEARRLAEDLSAHRLAWRPPAGGWGVGDCLEHLVASGGQYLGAMRPAFERARAGGGEPVHGGWRPTLAGRLLIHGVNSPRKLPSPRRFRPPPAPRPEVLAAFLDVQAALRELMTAADGLDLRRVRFASPVTPLARLNLGDAVQILQDHARRHLTQALRVREHPDFPTA
jgi:hypothetical protein